jgi:hypothetical protein
MRRALFLPLLVAACHTPRVDIDGRGYLVIEQKPRFFVGLCHVPTADFEKVSKLGFNVVTSPAFWGPANDPKALEALVEAQRHDLFVIADVDTPQALRAKNDLFRLHPSLLAWWTFTDPEFTVTDEQVAKDTFREIIRNDDDHPIAMSFRDPRAFATYGKYGKLLSIDIFPVPDLPLVSVPALVRQAWAETVNRSVWVSIQLCEARHSEPPDPKPLRRPTLEEVRAMTYLALIQSARGVLFFSYEKGDLPVKAPGLWKGVQELAAELRKAEPIIMVRNAGAIEIGGTAVHAAYRHTGNEWYLIYANPFPEPAKSEIDLPAGPLKQVTLDLKPFQAGIFRITPEGKLESFR